MTPYTRYRDYSQFQSDNPDTDLNGADLDVDFDRVKTTTDSLQDAIEDIRRADGALANDTVGPDQLTAAVIAMMGDWTPRGDWATATVYAAKDIVLQTNILYACVTAHTSGTFATDLAAGKWMRIGPATSAVNVSNTPAGSIAATTVQAAIDELDSEKQPLDATLTALAGMATAANKLIYATGADTFATADLTAAGRALLDDANATAQLVTLGALPLAGGTMTGAIVLPGNPSVALQAAPKQYVDQLVGSAFAGAAGGRLTLATSTPVTTTDQTAKTTVYYTPYINNLLPIYDGAAWTATVFSELSLALDSDAGHTGYHQSGKLFDLFVFNDSGTLRLGTGPAWSSDTAQSAAVARVSGRWVNNASIQLRWGTGATDLSTVAANLATWVGTFRMTAGGQTEDSAAKRFLWNLYNRVPRPMRAIDTTDSWSYTTATIRQANNAAANQLDFVRGLDEDAVEATAIARWANDTSGGIGFTMIGLDATNASATGSLFVSGSAAAANAVVTSHASYRGFPGVGRHFLAWLEKGNGSGTHTWSGDGGGTVTQSGINGMVMA